VSGMAAMAACGAVLCLALALYLCHLVAFGRIARGAALNSPGPGGTGFRPWRALNARLLAGRPEAVYQ